MNILKMGFFILSSICLMMAGCNKILDEKPDKAMVVPKSIADFQALLDYTTQMNRLAPSLDVFLSDNYYLSDATYDGLTDKAKNVYRWGIDPYNGPYDDWALAYNEVYYCNLAIEGISGIKTNAANIPAWNNVIGSALFSRAEAFLHTAFIFCKSYDASSAKKDYGIVLRTSSDFNKKSIRENLYNTYGQIITDLKSAAKLLPNVPVTPYRPSKPAAYGLLARTYLSMRDYENAGKYADSCLKIKDDLMNYNLLDTNALSPYSNLNPEVIFQQCATQNIITPINTRVDTTLYKSYLDNDLRKPVFFYKLVPGFFFKGNYSGSTGYLFTGIATDEIYLTLAECYARAGEISNALKYLNFLIKNRIRSDHFIPFNEQDPDKLLSLILIERRKELIFRCLRWMDLKRLNKEGANITLMRIIHGQTYTLKPNDNRYAYPLPTDLIERTGMPQNPY